MKKYSKVVDGSCFINEQMGRYRQYDLEERLIYFSVSVILISENLPNNPIGKYFKNQIPRSAASVALNYGEAQGASSRADFIHKLRICLKESRETQIGLKIISRSGLLREEEVLPLISECNELVAILTKSVQTASTK